MAGERPRPAARALILRDGKILTLHMRDALEEFYVLPGGGQAFNETLHECLHREAREELGTGLEIGKLICVREYLAPRHRKAAIYPAFHAVESIFLCTLRGEPDLSKAHEPDKGQLGLEWLPLAELTQYRLYPGGIRAPLQRGKVDEIPPYLGDDD